MRKKFTVLSTGLAEPAAAAAPAGPAAVPVTLKINGKPQNLTIEPRVTLLDALRNHLDLTGAKRVCDRGTCGACTVIMNGKVVYSCTVLAIDAQGKDIQTIEGLVARQAASGLGRLRQSTTRSSAATARRASSWPPRDSSTSIPSPTYEEVKEGLGGNLCRCGTYMGIRKAVLEAAKEDEGRTQCLITAGHRWKNAASWASASAASTARQSPAARAKYNSDMNPPGPAVRRAADLAPRARASQSHRHQRGREDAGRHGGPRHLHPGHRDPVGRAPRSRRRRQTEEIAREAVRKIKVDYEVLPHVVREDDLAKVGNRAKPAGEQVTGDPDKAFKDADAVSEG